MFFLKFLFCISFLFANVFAEFGVSFNGLAESKPGWAFQGKLLKNATTAYVSPELKAIPVAGISKSMTICGYTVHHDPVSYFPFAVLVTDKRSGYGEIKLKLNVERDVLKSLYTFQIEAYDCDLIPHYSKRKFVQIDIETVRQPVFTSSSFHFSTNVNTAVGTKIGSVTAFERPEMIALGHGSDGICKYAIVSSFPVPFTIDQLGSIFTKVLVLGKVKSVRYRFTVRASDCRQPTPTISTVLVTVDVFDDCEPHWTGLPSSVEYNGDKAVLPVMVTKMVTPSLHLCSMQCQNLLAVVTVKLLGEDMKLAEAKSCKRDYISLTQQEKICDVSSRGVDVLTLAADHLRDRSDGSYRFDGSNVVPIDDKFSKFGHGRERKFTVMFWMKHDRMEQGAPKEQILCNSDGQEHNRHHLSLFLHNCKLILLSRKESNEGDRASFTPSEWRYGPLKQVCDNEWHHYAVRFNEGSVSVQVDGEMTTHSPQYLDDQPLLASPSGINTTKFTVAACFHSKTDKYVQYFKGHLASLKILDGELEAMNNIRCVATCGEALVMPHLVDVIDRHSSVTLTSDSVKIQSDDVFNLLTMLSGLSYINTDLTKESIRTISISTELSCDRDQVSTVPTRSVIIQLRKGSTKKPTERLLINIAAVGNVIGYTHERVALFPTIKFTRHAGAPSSLQSCIARPMGPALHNLEYLDWPQHLVIDLHLSAFNNSHGLYIDGKQELRNYETLLRNVYYVTRQSDDNGIDRKFSISCSIVGQSMTDEMVVSVDMRGARDLKTYYIVDDPIQDQQGVHEHIEHQGQGESMIHVENEDPKKGSKSTVVVWAVVSCVSLVVIVAAVGLAVWYRRFKHRPRKVFLNDIYERRYDRVKITANPMVTEGGKVEDDDVPDSEDGLDDHDEVDDDATIVAAVAV